MHEALDAVLDAHERTERNELRDLARHDLADGVGAGEELPRVFLSGLERKRHALAIHLDREDLDLDGLTNLDNLARVVDVLPGELGNVDEAVDTAEVHERTEVDDRGDVALANLALLEGLEEVGANRSLGLFEVGAAREHDVVAVLVELDDLRFELLADVRLKVAHAAHLDERSGEEAAKADVDDEAALDNLNDGAGNDTFVFLDVLDRAPCALVLRTLLREDQAAFLVLLLENERLDLVADLDDLIGVDIVLDREFAGRDDAFGLVADVKKNLVPVNLDDGALDDVAIVEVLDGRIDSGEKFLFATDIVDGDLRCVVRGHVVNGSVGTGSSWYRYMCGHSAHTLPSLTVHTHKGQRNHLCETPIPGPG